MSQALSAGAPRRLILAALAAFACCAGSAHADGDNKIYMHRNGNGVRAFSDLKRLPGYAYLGEYRGRPTAAASCTGMTPAKLEARAANYADLIARHAQQRGLEPALVKAVMRVESCFDARAVSPVGAHGLMQLMPQTAELLGVRDRFSPEQNIGGGTQYLQAMLERFHGDLNLALAAYNAGPEAVERYRGIPPYPETQSYVRRVTAQYREYLAQPAAAPPLNTAQRKPAAEYTTLTPRPGAVPPALSPLDPGTNLSER